MDMKTSAQASATATERQAVPAVHNGDGEAGAQRSAPVPQAAHSSAPPGSERDPSGDWAICCSGGGIRSATYCLGGLQSLDELGLLGKAKWIVGVSGGSYIAASRALVAEGLHRAKEK